MAELKPSRGSALKDLLLVLKEYFDAEIISTEFPPDLNEYIANYVLVHDDGDGFDGSRQILTELRELAAQSSARGSPKLPLLLKCLKELSEVLDPSDVIDAFEDSILNPLMTSYGMNRQTVADARDVLLFCLLPARNSAKEFRLAAVHYHLFDIYMQKSEELLQGYANPARSAGMKNVVSIIEKVLFDFGGKCPKHFFHALDKYFVLKENRRVAGYLAARFCSVHDAHLGQILETDFPDHLLQCLEIDTSSAVVAMALSVLDCALPHICHAIGERIPEVFFILYRLFNWTSPKRPRENSDLQVIEESVWPLGQRRESWDMAEGSDEMNGRINVSKIDHLFTYLYGMYPVNFVKFVSSPIEYLESHNIIMSSQHESLFKAEAERLLCRHHFNTDMLKYTLESELTSKEKWEDMHPSEITTKCGSLDSTNKYHTPSVSDRPSDPPTAPLPKTPTTISALTKSLEIQGQRNFGLPMTEYNFSVHVPTTRSRAGSGIAPSSAEDMSTVSNSRAPSRVGVRNTIMSNGSAEIIGFGDAEPAKPREFAEDLAFSRRTSQLTEMSNPADSRKHSEESLDVPEVISSLETELKLLETQLAFERVLKGRYLQQIGRMQRKKMQATASDLEREHFTQEIAHLKQSNTTLQDEVNQLKSSSQAFRNQRAAVEDSLYAKLRVYNDDRAQIHAKMTQLERDGERLRKENVALRRDREEKAADVTKLANGHQPDGESTAAIESLKAEVAEWKDRLGSQRDLESSKVQLESNMKQLEMKLHAAEDENRKLSIRITQLQDEISAASKYPHANPRIRNILDKLSKDHEDELAKWSDRHNTLLRQYRSLEDAYRELQHARESDRREFYRQLSLMPSMDGDTPRILDDAGSGSPRSGGMPWETGLMVGSPPPPEVLPSVMGTYGITPHIPMVGHVSGSQTTASVSTGDGNNLFGGLLPRRGPSSASSSGKSGSAKIKPNSEIRIYGRGGAQNMGLKTKKDKKAGSGVG